MVDVLVNIRQCSSLAAYCRYSGTFLINFMMFLKYWQNTIYKFRICTKLNNNNFNMSFQSTEKDKQRKQFTLNQQVGISITTDLPRVKSQNLTIEQNELSHIFNRYSIDQQPQLLKNGWTKEEEEQLYKLHDSIGNKWALIAHKMTGRTDNCVKNFFYSKLRKSLRKLNNAIKSFFRKQFKEIKMTTIYKVVEAHQQGHKNKRSVQQETVEFCRNLKNKLLQFSEFDQIQLLNQTKRKDVKKIIKDLAEFNRKYKRQIKRKRKNSGNDEFVVGSASRRRSNKVQSEIDSQEEISEDIEIIPSNEGQIFHTFVNMMQRQQKEKEKCSIPMIQEKKQGLESKKTMDMVQQPIEDDVQGFLRCEGMIENQPSIPPILFLKKDLTKFSIFSGRCSEGNLQHDMFFDDSVGLPNLHLCNTLSHKKSEFHDLC